MVVAPRSNAPASAPLCPLRHDGCSKEQPSYLRSGKAFTTAWPLLQGATPLPPLRFVADSSRSFPVELARQGPGAHCPRLGAMPPRPAMLPRVTPV